MFNLELIGRILLAGLCGIIIGIERNMRSKEAGIRTHCIVACASALMMIVSKYGFFDLLENAKIAADVRLDPSRMAQGIVTGVGFLGAGLIYLQRGAINGLTTAAGVWAVSGIGMAIGAGMYVVGISSAIIVLLIQVVLHTRLSVSSRYKTKTFKVYNVDMGHFQRYAEEKLGEMKISVIDVSAWTNENGNVDYSFCLELPKTVLEEDLIRIFNYKCSVEITR